MSSNAPRPAPGQVPPEDIHSASQMLVRALAIREEHMSESQQSFPPTAARFLRTVPATATQLHGVRTHIHGEPAGGRAFDTAAQARGTVSVRSRVSGQISTINYGIRTQIRGKPWRRDSYLPKPIGIIACWPLPMTFMKRRGGRNYRHSNCAKKLHLSYTFGFNIASW